jgi:hypothetical protein
MALPETFSDDASYISPGVETRDSQLRVHYQQDEHVAMRRGTASGSVCGWPEASGEGSALLESVSETDHYLFVDTSLPA